MNFRMDYGANLVAGIFFRECLPVVLEYFTDGKCCAHSSIVKDEAGLCKENVRIGTKSLDPHERGVAAFFTDKKEYRIHTDTAFLYNDDKALGKIANLNILQ